MKKILRDDYDGDYEIVNGDLYCLYKENEPLNLVKKNINENDIIKSMYEKEDDYYSYLNVNGEYCGLHSNKIECVYDYTSKNKLVLNNAFEIMEMELSEDEEFFTVQKDDKIFYIITRRNKKSYMCFDKKPKNVILHTLAEEILIETYDGKYYIFNIDLDEFKEVEMVDTPILKNYRDWEW